MSGQTERELEELQRRIDWRRATLRLDEGNRKPVAVRFFDDQLFYGEFYEHDPEADVTFFGLARPSFLRSTYPLLQVAARIKPTPVPRTVRMGDTRSQPYEGKALFYDAQHDGYEWFTTLRFVADEDGVLVKYTETEGALP